MLKERKALFFTFCLGVVLLGSACSGTVYADADSITKNWLISQYANKCVNREKDTIESAASGKVIDSIIGPDTNNIALPSFGFNGLPADGIISCKKLLSGKGGAPSILSYKDPDLKNTKWSDTDGVRNPDVLLRGVLKYTPEGTAYAFRIAARNESDDQLVKSAQITAVSNSGALSYSRGMINSSVVDLGGTIGNHELEVSIQSCMDAIPIRLSSVSIDYTYDMIHRALDNKSCQNRFNGTTYKFEPDSVVADKVTPSAKKYTGGGSRSFVAELNSGINDVSLSKDEIYDLYYFYLDKKLPTGVVDRMTCEQTSTTGLKEVKLAIEDRTVKNCYVNFNGEDPKNIAVNVVNNSEEANGVKFSNIRSGNMQDVIDWLNRNLTVGEILETGSISSEEGESSEEEGERDPCYGGDLGSMAWILCPAEDNLEKVNTGLMGMIDDLLNIDTDYYDAETHEGEPTAAYQIWEYARGFANVFMIIILLIIIFSQLTGVGINNYGIKKMLPRLIVMAILINLSFIICQVLIDISNILGNSLNLMLHSIGSSIGGGRENFSFSDIIGGLIAGAAGAAAGAEIVIGGIAVISGLGAGSLAIVVIVGILVLLVALVAVLMFFVSLALRIMIVVLFTAISPLAFACYILPNTQKIFKRWWDVFKAALLVFPICGGLYGLSFIVRAIAFSGSQLSFAMAMVGLIASVLPFLLLPTLLKKSVAGLGVIGDKINGVGTSLNRGLRRGLNSAKNTDAYKNTLDQGRTNLANRNNIRIRRRHDNRVDRSQRLNEEEKNEMKKIRNKLYNGEELSDKEQERLEKLEKKALGSMANTRIGRNRLRQASDARNKINEAEKKMDSYMLGASSLVAAGQRKSDETDAEKKRRDAMDWHQGHFMGADGTIYNRSADGKSWIGVDKDGKKQTISDESARLAAAAGNGAKMISHSEALLAKDSVGRSEQYGQLAGMARAVGQGDVNEVADAAAASALRSSVDGVADTLVSGQGDVLKVEHAKAQNQRTMINAEAKVGVAEVTSEVALGRAEASRLASERKIWEDQFSRADTNTLNSALEDAIRMDRDEPQNRISAAAKIGAAFEALKSTGNLPKIFNNLDRPGVWDNMSDAMKLELNQDMIKSGDITMAAFAKENFKSGGKLDFYKFISGEEQKYMGVDDNGNSKEKVAKSLADYIVEKGSHGLDGQDKDSIEHLANRIEAMSSNVASPDKKNALNGMLARQMISGYATTQKGEEKANFLGLLDRFKNTFTGGEGSDDFVSTMKATMSAATLVKMDTGIYKALGARGPEIVKSAVDDLKLPDNAQLLAAMSPSLRQELGL